MENSQTQLSTTVENDVTNLGKNAEVSEGRPNNSFTMKLVTMILKLFTYFIKFLCVIVILLLKFVVIISKFVIIFTVIFIITMASNVKTSIRRSYEIIKNKNNINGVNSEKIFTKNDFIETRQGDTLSENSVIVKCNLEDTKIEEMKIKEEKQEEKEVVKLQIDEVLTKVLKERGEEFIKIRIGFETQEIKEINCGKDIVYDLNAHQVEKYKKCLNEIINSNRTKLNRLKDQLEFGKTKLLQANQSIVHLTGIKKLHEGTIEDQIKSRDNILQISHHKENKVMDCGFVDYIAEKRMSTNVVDFEKSGYKAFQNIQNLLEQKRHLVKDIGEKENALKERVIKVEEYETYFDPEWVPDRNLSKIFKK